jgi:hypothetical protein
MRAATLVSAALATAALLFAAPIGAKASTTQLAMFEEDAVYSNPSQTLQIMRSLGVDIIRVGVAWSEIAPDAGSRTRPAGFNAADPAAYPQANWSSLDAIINAANSDGIAVDLMVTGGAPLWATADGAPPGFEFVWGPSPAEYGQFVQAVATRYPSVHFWELWNEANYGPQLAPQVLPGSTAIASAAEYRLLNAYGWQALQATGHGRDTIVDGNLSQDGSAQPTTTSITAPLPFLRALYCVDASYHPLQGVAAQAAGCPTTPAGSAQFVADNPGLFVASGIGAHPYPYGAPPNRPQFPSQDGAEFAELPRLGSVLSALQHAYNVSNQPAIFITEYGYETRPPQTSTLFDTPPVAAKYINWAEYLAWKNPRIASTDQYLIFDGNFWFTTGLVFPNGRLKPGFYAYRMPVWLPRTKTKRGRKLEVWGCVRPAHFAQADTRRPQYVSIQFARGSSSTFRTVRRLRITNIRGYFDVKVEFPASGRVRLAWRYPPGDSRLNDPLVPGQSWIYSRTTSVTIRAARVRRHH